MNRKSFLLYVSLLLSIPCFVVAHPLDVSNTTLSIYSTTIEWSTTLHPVELDHILINSGNILPESITPESYYENREVLFSYMKQAFHMKSGNTLCTMTGFSLEEGLFIDEMYSRWFPISYRFECPTLIDTLTLDMQICTDLSLQTNRVSLYANTSQWPKTIAYKVFTSKYTTATIWMQYITSLDSDHDGLSDEEERWYGTNESLMDTDGDNYTDSEEIRNSWNPLSKDPGPWQTERLEIIPISTPGNNTIHSWSLSSGIWWGMLFESILQRIRVIAWEKFSSYSFVWIWWSVLFLGFFHALGPGHSKTFLVTSLLDSTVSWLQWVKYSAIFTFTHLADILVLAIITKGLFLVNIPSHIITYLQQISVVLLCILSLFFLIRALVWRISPQKKENIPHNQKKIYIYSFLTGLLPCGFGWSMFLVLFSLGKVVWIFPLLLALGIGIFLCLVTVTTVTLFLQKRVYTFSPRIATYSTILSNGLLFLLSSLLLIQVF